jgi:hypothetical protein
MRSNKEQFRRLVDWHKQLQAWSTEHGEGMLGVLLDEGWVAEASEFFSGVWTDDTVVCFISQQIAEDCIKEGE